MRVSARAEYACMAIYELAARLNDGAPTPLHTIATSQGIPNQFLVQILAALQKAGLVRSERGPQGGYHLTRNPADITLGEVVKTIDGPLIELKCLDKEDNLGCNLEPICSFPPIWQEVQHAMYDVLDRLNFQEIVAKTVAKRAQALAMNYHPQGRNFPHVPNVPTPSSDGPPEPPSGDPQTHP